LDSQPEVRWVAFLAASIQGVGLAIMLNTATSLISDVIGKDEQSSAFVYGAYSFLDKLSNGVILFFITVMMTSLILYIRLTLRLMKQLYVSLYHLHQSFALCLHFC
jgi:Na+/melibiose symporter-like transporter